MKIIIILVIYFLLNVCSINALNHNLSEKVMIWNHPIKIYKCPIHLTEEIQDDIDPSILIFKNKDVTENLEKTPVIVANQTDYLAHHVKSYTTFNDFTFAYAAMASLHVLFDRVHIIDQPGYFEDKKAHSSPNQEHVPDEDLIDRLKTKTVKDNVLELNSSPVYKCMGQNGSIYLLIKSSNITSYLKVDDIIEYPISLSQLAIKIKLLVSNKMKEQKTILSKKVNANFFKRIFDITFSLLALLALSPILLIVALLIKIDSKGPVFFTSKRVGSGYQIFDFFKFRSMKTGAEHLIDHMKGQNQYKAVSTSTEDSTCEDCEKLGRACSSILFIDGKHVCENSYFNNKQTTIIL